MIEGWEEKTLGDAITLQRGHDLPRTKMLEGSIPVAGSNGVVGSHNEATTQGPGVTIGRSGNVGNAYFYPQDFWAHNTTLYVKDFKGNDPRFVYYFLTTFDFSQFNAGSAVPTLNRNHIHPIDIEVPKPAEQKAIAEILSSLDDKIDLLHRQNATLEALAETLFRQYFIEDAQDDWEEVDLGKLVSFRYGKALKKSVRTGKGFPVVGSGGVVDFHREAMIDGIGIVTGRKGTLGELYYFTDGFFPIDTTFYIAPKRETENQLFEYFLLKTIDFKRMNSDSAVPGLNKTIAESHPVKNPPAEAKLEFDSTAGLIFDKITFNNRSINALCDLRDTLLPKLMSGAVRVSLDSYDG